MCCRSPDVDHQKRQRLRAAILQKPVIASGSRTPPSTARNTKHAPSRGRANPMYDEDLRLTVDLGDSSQQQKTKSLPGYARRKNSTPNLKNQAHTTKRPKRRCASDNDKGSSSSQEQIYPLYAPLLPNTSATLAGHQRFTAVNDFEGRSVNGTLPARLNRGGTLAANDSRAGMRLGNDGRAVTYR